MFYLHHDFVLCCHSTNCPISIFRRKKFKLRIKKATLSPRLLVIPLINKWTNAVFVLKADVKK
jgi:hypothetical protein